MLNPRLQSPESAGRGTHLNIVCATGLYNTGTVFGVKRQPGKVISAPGGCSLSFQKQEHGCGKKADRAEGVG